MTIELKCCTCGETKSVEVNSLPTLGIELYSIAGEAGWNPVLDLKHGRTLVFCPSNDCLKRQITKNGDFRKRIIPITQ